MRNGDYGELEMFLRILEGSNDTEGEVKVMGQTYQSTVIKAPVEKVWKKLRNFHDMSWASGVIDKCEPVGELKGNQIGAKRLLNDVFHETLLALSEVDRSVKYSIDEGPSPISSKDIKGYVGSIRVLPATEDNATFVEWSSSWHGNDEPAHEFCHPIYVALLGALKKSFE